MRDLGKYLLFLLLLSGSRSYSQQLDSVCDSVFLAVTQNDPSILRKLSPGYKDLRAVYDSSDIEKMNYQIGLRQKEIEWNSGRDLKKMNRWLKREKIQTSALVKKEISKKVYPDPSGYHYATVIIISDYKKRRFHIHFTLIQLNEGWFYGEGLKIEEVPVPIEAEPDY